MSAHCPKCGTYHEEDDDRLCAKCVNEARIVSCEHKLDVSPSGRMATCLLCNAMYRSNDGGWDRVTTEKDGAVGGMVPLANQSVESGGKSVVPAGHILDGVVVRKVLGSGLALTLDGHVITPGARVWRIEDAEPLDGERWTDGWVVLSVDRGELESNRFQWVTLHGIGEATTQSLYSSLEAAEAARSALKAGAS